MDDIDRRPALDELATPGEPEAGDEWADYTARGELPWWHADNDDPYASGTGVRKAHDCGEPGRPVRVVQCGDCWDVEDEHHAVRSAPIWGAIR